MTFKLTPCLKKCRRMERSKFAKRCKKDKGFFKCCGTHWRIDAFETARNQLIDEGLVKDKKTHYCKKPSARKSKCHFCSITGICSKKHPITGTVKNTIYPGNKTFKQGRKVFITCISTSNALIKPFLEKGL